MTSLTVPEAPLVLAMATSRLLSDTGAGGVATLVSNRIFRDVAPDGTAYPLVTVSWLSAVAEMTANAIHVMSDVLILVKIVATGMDRSPIEALEKRILTILDQYGDVTLRGVYAVRFRLVEQPSQPDRYEDGIRYQMSNLVFKTEASPA